MEIYNPKECAVFFSSKDPNFLLSNMAGGMPIRHNKQVWKSSEHLYQASKYAADTECVPGDGEKCTEPNVRKRIQMVHSPMGAKMTQKCAVKAGLVRPDWNDVMVDNMRYVLQLKLFFNKDTFGEVLLQTGKLTIVEKSRKDDFWGAMPYLITMLRGQNKLGYLLMEIRDNAQHILRGEFSEPANFLLK